MRTLLSCVLLCLALSSCNGRKAKEAFGEFVVARDDVEKRLPTEAPMLADVGALGAAGASFQAKAQALADEARRLRARNEAANQQAAVALADTDVDGIRAARAELEAVGRESDRVSEQLAALMKAVAEAAKAPDTTTLAEVAVTSGEHLERVFARAGWKQPPSAARGVMKASGYTYENLELAKDRAVMTVFIVRPCADCTGNAGTTPAQSAEAARAQNKVFLFDEKADVYVELMPKVDATDADARALLEAIVKTE